MDQYIKDAEPVHGVMNLIEKNIDCQNKWQLQLLQMAVAMIGKKGPFKFDITSLVRNEMVDDQTEMYIGRKDILTPKDALQLLKEVDKYLEWREEKEFVEIVQIKENKYILFFKDLHDKK
jgi:hypothetical protein